MRSGLIDTNLLLYAANEDAPEHSTAKAFLESATASPETWFLTDGILYEFLRVVTHPKVFPRPLDWNEALDFLDPLIEADNLQRLQPGENHWKTLRALLPLLTHPSGNLFFDIRTATLMREHGVRLIYTTDTDFLQFPDIEAVNPLNGLGQK